MESQYHTSVALTPSSKKWLERQKKDPFVKKAKQEGYRARSAYKLIEIQKKYRILNPKKFVLDLGAAPGGWSQVALEYCGSGRVTAIDLLQMQPLSGVSILTGDFEETLTSLNQEFSVILSDMAPSTCGISSVDHIRIMDILERVFELSHSYLAKGGHLVIKVFKGGTEHEFLKILKTHFEKVHHFKPESSRKESKEMYMVALNFKKTNKI